MCAARPVAELAIDQLGLLAAAVACTLYADDPS